MDLSYSAIATFKACRRKYKFSNVDRIIPKKESTKTSVGSIIHQAFEEYFNGKTKQQALQFIIDKFNERLSDPQLDPWEHEDLLVNKYIAMGMWEYYPFTTSATFERVLPEQYFRVPIPGFKSVYLVGFLDGLVKDDGKPMVREVKTTGDQIDKIKLRADISMQGSGYVWAAQKALGQKVHGIYYDIIRKPLLRKGKNEDAQGFAERNYQYYQDPANHPKLYGTHCSWRVQTQLDQFESDLIQDVKDILRIKRMKYPYQRNTDCCYMYNRECPYKKICFQESVDKDFLDAFYMERKPREVGRTKFSFTF